MNVTELEAKEREIADLQAGWQRTYDHDVARLQERLAAAERDAERYRWLRTSNWLASYGWAASEIDAVVDAAREGGK